MAQATASAEVRSIQGRDRAIVIPALGSAGEIGDMARSAAVFRDNAIEADALAVRERAEQALKEQRRHTLEAPTRDIDRDATGVLDAVTRPVGDMRGTAATMSAVAARNSARATAVAAGTHETSTNVQTVASATEQLSASATGDPATETGAAASQVEAAAATLAGHSQRLREQVDAFLGGVRAA